jgi:hypothetical protein
MRLGPRHAGQRNVGVRCRMHLLQKKLQFGGTYQRSEFTKRRAVVLGPLKHKLATKFMQQNACGGGIETTPPSRAPATTTQAISANATQFQVADALLYGGQGKINTLVTPHCTNYSATSTMVDTVWGDGQEYNHHSSKKRGGPFAAMTKHDCARRTSAAGGTSNSSRPAHQSGRFTRAQRAPQQ